LNIPDTSGRDSLFQAESRRCKDIIDIILANQGASDRHYCIFDELYSGTNPTEATKSAYAFLMYLGNFKNVNFILTTHYLSVCKRFKRSTAIQNYQMDAEIDEETGKIAYTYKIRRGISKIQGAVKILEEMNYPREILDTIQNYHKNRC
jgi:DNA mismatch repair ATPase MutS